MSNDATPVALGPVGFARWIWRQLTSMRTALILLLLLAIASIPGSLIPQDGLDPNKSAIWRSGHPHLTPIYEKLDLFKVYSAPWFAAIYVLLMISLVGCIIPRLFVYARALRAQPPRTPKNLGRFEDSVAYVSDDTPEVVLERAAAQLHRYRLRRDDPTSVSAEKGFLREAGNLVFHLSIIIVLIGFATGQLFGFKATVQFVVGPAPDYGFSNQLTQYDVVSSGSLWKASSLDPFTMNVNSFTMDWSRGSLGGDFLARGTYTVPGEAAQPFDLKVNHPLTIGSTSVFLIGHGYAPIITLRDARGHVLVSGPTIFETLDGTFHSQGALLASSALPEPYAISCDFFPVLGTNGISSVTGDLTSHGIYPGGTGHWKNLPTLRGDGAALSCFAWEGKNGSLGRTTAFAVDSSSTTKVTDKGGRAFNLVLAKSASTLSGTVLHNTVKLPDGLGSITFEGIAQWTQLQVSMQPGRKIALGGVSLALFGLMGSLFIRPRRVWVRATPTAGGTLVEIASLDRTGGGDTAAYVTALKDKLAMKEGQDV